MNADGFMVEDYGSSVSIVGGEARRRLPLPDGVAAGSWSLSSVTLSDGGQTAAGTAVTAANGLRAALVWRCR